jgi:hypothetical protein
MGLASSIEQIYRDELYRNPLETDRVVITYYFMWIYAWR